jgi:hypothetical protein
LIFIYGPPAVGKLTIATLVAERLGYRVLHNHLTIDPVAQIVDYGTPAFWRIVGALRRDLVAAAAEAGTGLVCTYVYAPGDEATIDELVAPFERRAGVVFVRLTAPREVLLERVVSESRNAHAKIGDVETLNALLDAYDVQQAIPERPSVTLDTTVLTPVEAAARIVAHWAP